MRATPTALTALLVLTLTSGCVRRTISITSAPSGALVWLNDREIGRTPVEVEFLHYGTYDVRLVRDGCETLATTGEAKAPLWDVVGLDLVAEAFEPQSRVEWHYELLPADTDGEALVERALDLRTRTGSSDS